MEVSLNKRELLDYVCAQLDHFFPDKRPIRQQIHLTLDSTLERVETCFKQIKLSSFSNNGIATFNHLHSDQYAMFLYLLSNEVWKRTQDKFTSEKIMYLNKALHAVNCMYDNELPTCFAFIHAVGTVIGKAEFSNYIAFYQGVTVGAQDGDYPLFGENIQLHPHSSIVGNCQIGNNVKIGIASQVYNQNINDNSIIFTNTNGEQIIKENKKSASSLIFNF